MRRLLMLAVALTVTSSDVAAQDAARLSGDAFVAIRVADVAAAAAWYARVFDLREVNRLEGDAYSIRILSGGGLSVELIQQPRVPRPEERHLGLFKAGLFVDDAEQYLQLMRSRGVDTDEATFVDEALLLRSFVMRDLEGNRLQVFSRRVP